METIIKHCVMLGLIIMTCVQPTKGVTPGEIAELGRNITKCKQQIKGLWKEINGFHQKFDALTNTLSPRSSVPGETCHRLTELNKQEEQNLAELWKDIKLKEKEIEALRNVYADGDCSEDGGEDVLRINIDAKEAHVDEQRTEILLLLMRKIETLRRKGLKRSHLDEMSKYRQAVWGIWKQRMELRDSEPQEKIAELQEKMNERKQEYEKRAGSSLTYLEKSIDTAEAQNDNQYLGELKKELRIDQLTEFIEDRKSKLWKASKKRKNNSKVVTKHDRKTFVRLKMGCDSEVVEWKHELAMLQDFDSDSSA